MSEITKTETGSRIAIPWPPFWKMDMTSSLCCGWSYLDEIWQADAEWFVCRGCLMCSLKMPKLVSTHTPKEQIFMKKTWQFTTPYMDGGSKVAELKQQISQKMILLHSTVTFQQCAALLRSNIISLQVGLKLRRKSEGLAYENAKNQYSWHTICPKMGPLACVCPIQKA